MLQKNVTALMFSTVANGSSRRKEMHEVSAAKLYCVYFQATKVKKRNLVDNMSFIWRLQFRFAIRNQILFSGRSITLNVSFISPNLSTDSILYCRSIRLKIVFISINAYFWPEISLVVHYSKRYTRISYMRTALITYSPLYPVYVYLYSFSGRH